MGLLALSALILVGSGFILMKNNLSALKPGGKKIEEIFLQLDQAVPMKQSELAPLGEINIELLSANELKGVAKSKISGIEVGVMATLFDERVSLLLLKNLVLLISKLWWSLKIRIMYIDFYSNQMILK